MKSTLPQISDFLTAGVWQDGVDLLNFQVGEKKFNRHYHTLSMYYYESMSVISTDVRSESYFLSRIGNNLFYVLEKEFGIFHYLMPKSGLGIRNYTFFSYPMRALYYAIGIYIFRLSWQFLLDFKSEYKYIRSFYGASLVVDNTKLIINKNTTNFRNPYSSFRKLVRGAVSGDNSNHVVIRLDIKDFFDEISIPILLEHLLKHVKTSIKKDMSFESTVVEQVKSFFLFISRGKSGIPQYENDIISSFLGYLYLVFADIYIDKEVCRDDAIIEDHKILRYVDDIYISIKFAETISRIEQENCIESLCSRIADILYYKLRLKLNTKTCLFFLDREKDLESLLKVLKKTSTQYPINDDENTDSPQDKVERIFQEIHELKHSSIDNQFMQDREVEQEILKEIYDKHVDNLMQKEENIERIRDLFNGFNFNLVRASPRELCIIILKDDVTANNYRNFLFAKHHLTTVDVSLILDYLCQTGLDDIGLMDVLRKNRYIQPVIDLFASRSAINLNPGYYSLSYDQVAKISSMQHVVEQARLRIISEIYGNYSLALSHLLNEIHALCLHQDPSGKSHKDYNVNDVKLFLKYKGVSYDIISNIANLFDRRNINQVSHPGYQDVINWGVERDEYYEYRKNVAECMSLIL